MIFAYKKAKFLKYKTRGGPMKKILTMLIAGVLIFVSGDIAEALVIDFTDYSIWGGANGLNNFSHDYGDITVSLTSDQGGPLNISSIGVGVLDEQISYIYNTDPPDVMHDSLSVTFSENAVVTSFSYLDLFADEGPSGEPETARANFGQIGPNTLIY